MLRSAFICFVCVKSSSFKYDLAAVDHASIRSCAVSLGLHGYVIHLSSNLEHGYERKNRDFRDSSTHMPSKATVGDLGHLDTRRISTCFQWRALESSWTSSAVNVWFRCVQRYGVPRSELFIEQERVDTAVLVRWCLISAEGGIK